MTRIETAQREAVEAFRADRAAGNVQLPYPTDAARTRARMESNNQPWPTADGPAPDFSEAELNAWVAVYCAAYADAAAEFCNES